MIWKAAQWRKLVSSGDWQMLEWEEGGKDTQLGQKHRNPPRDEIGGGKQRGNSIPGQNR